MIIAAVVKGLLIGVAAGVGLVAVIELVGPELFLLIVLPNWSLAMTLWATRPTSSTKSASPPM